MAGGGKAELRVENVIGNEEGREVVNLYPKQKDLSKALDIDSGDGA